MSHTDHIRIYIFGASGTGTTTLGENIATELGLVHVDCDDHYWAPVEPPFSIKRTPEDRVVSMRSALGHKGWVLTGACNGWGRELIDQAQLIVFATLPTQDRLQRLRAREKARFGGRIEEGGDMFQIHRDLMRWAAGYDDPTFSGRNIAIHEKWLAEQSKHICRIDATRRPQEAMEKVIRELSES
ncbi:MAG: adenylate kinase [Litoreibacter sp.]